MLPPTDQAVPCTSRPDLYASNNTRKMGEAKIICATSCPILLRCLEHAKEVEALMGQPLIGVLGGLTPQERQETELRRIG